MSYRALEHSFSFVAFSVARGMPPFTGLQGWKKGRVVMDGEGEKTGEQPMRQIQACYLLPVISVRWQASKKTAKDAKGANHLERQMGSFCRRFLRFKNQFSIRPPPLPLPEKRGFAQATG